MLAVAPAMPRRHEQDADVVVGGDLLVERSLGPGADVAQLFAVERDVEVGPVAEDADAGGVLGAARRGRVGEAELQHLGRPPGLVVELAVDHGRAIDLGRHGHRLDVERLKGLRPQRPAFRRRPGYAEAKPDTQENRRRENRAGVTADGRSLNAHLSETPASELVLGAAAATSCCAAKLLRRAANACYFPALRAGASEPTTCARSAPCHAGMPTYQKLDVQYTQP